MSKAVIVKVDSLDKTIGLSVGDIVDTLTDSLSGTCYVYVIRLRVKWLVAHYQLGGIHHA